MREAGLHWKSKKEKLEDVKLFERLCSYMKNTQDDAVQQKAFDELLDERPWLLSMTNKEGANALHVGIEARTTADKVDFLLTHDSSLASVPYKERLPLHSALETHPHDVIVENLLYHYEEAVTVKDDDGRLPLAILLELQPFPAAFVEIGQAMVDAYPEATTMGFRLPLHTCLINALPPRLVLAVLKGNRAAASVRCCGRLPLHTALEHYMDAQVVSGLVDAHPGALLQTMRCNGYNVVPLEYAIRQGKGQGIVECLLDVFDEASTGLNDAKAICYGHAAAVGLTSKPVREETPKSKRDELVFADGAGGNHRGQSQHRSRFVIHTRYGHAIPLEVDTRGSVLDLKAVVEDVEGTPVEQQRLSVDGKLLPDAQPLSDFDFKKECQVRLSQGAGLFRLAVLSDAGNGILLEIIKLHQESAFETTQSGITPLIVALQRAVNSTVVKRLIEINPAAVKVPVPMGEVNEGEYPLHLALRNGYDCDTVRAILKHAAISDWDSSGQFGNRRIMDGSLELRRSLPLHLAVEQGNDENMVQVMLQARCSIAGRDAYSGLSTLDYVIVAGRSTEPKFFEMVLRATLAERPGALDEPAPGNGRLPLHIASAYGTPSAVVDQICSMAPRSPDAFDYNGHLPLHLAAMHGARFGTVRSLLEHAAHTSHVRDSKGFTPLQLAVLHRAPSGIVLEFARVDPSTLEVRDGRNRSLVELAAAADAPAWVVQELCDVGPDEIWEVNVLNGKLPPTRATGIILEAARRRSLVKAAADREAALAASRKVCEEQEAPSTSVLGSLYSWLAG